MIHDLDETIRQILIRDGDFNQSQIDVSFETPNREWSQGISRPTLNCYLFDIRENLNMRHQGQTIEGHGTTGAARRPSLLRFDLTYLLTAWTRAVEDEHRMLWRALQTLSRFSTIPDTRLQGELARTEVPIYASIARPDSVLKSPGEFWTALENQLKPSLSYTVTAPLDRDATPAGPPVRAAQIMLRQPDTGAPPFFWFGGVVRSADSAPVAGATVTIAETGHRSTTDDRGMFRLPGYRAGSYTLLLHFEGIEQRSVVDVPAGSYDITLRRKA